MRLPLVLMALCMLLMSSLHTVAQSKHVYEDSSILYPDGTMPTEEKIMEVTTSSNYEEGANETITEKDTQLINNRLFLSPDSVKAFQNDKQFAYAKNLDSLLQEFKKQQEPKKETETKETNKKSSSVESFFNSKGTQYVLWSLAGLFILFVLYKLFFADGAFGKPSTKSNVKLIDEEEATPVKDRNFDVVIAKAANENNYRLAVRYMYLQLLQRLSAAGAIQFAVDKTNGEYLRELSGRPYKEEVATLTRYYDYVWYGEFDIDVIEYSKLESRFKNVVI